jgi:hypothetical protein
MTRKNTESKHTHHSEPVVLILYVQNPKVQMEELQWGFPIATALSLIKPISINGK